MNSLSTIQFTHEYSLIRRISPLSRIAEGT
ncbi:hypothetical protein M2277_006520 [Paenibacillus sp. LBL]|nr:hypothetical protein [Paenibacillus sp. LBL]